MKISILTTAEIITISGGVFGLHVPCHCVRPADSKHKGNNGVWIDTKGFSGCIPCMNWCCNQKGNGEHNGIAYKHVHTITKSDKGICGELPKTPGIMSKKDLGNFGDIAMALLGSK